MNELYLQPLLSYRKGRTKLKINRRKRRSICQNQDQRKIELEMDFVGEDKLNRLNKFFIFFPTLNHLCSVCFIAGLPRIMSW